MGGVPQTCRQGEGRTRETKGRGDRANVIQRRSARSREQEKKQGVAFAGVKGTI